MGVLGDPVIVDLDVDHVIGQRLELPTPEAHEGQGRDALLAGVPAKTGTGGVCGVGARDISKPPPDVNEPGDDDNVLPKLLEC